MGGSLGAPRAAPQAASEAGGRDACCVLRQVEGWCLGGLRVLATPFCLNHNFQLSLNPFENLDGSTKAKGLDYAED